MNAQAMIFRIILTIQRGLGKSCKPKGTADTSQSVVPNT